MNSCSPTLFRAAQAVQATTTAQAHKHAPSPAHQAIGALLPTPPRHLRRPCPAPGPPRRARRASRPLRFAAELCMRSPPTAAPEAALPRPAAVLASHRHDDSDKTTRKCTRRVAGSEHALRYWQVPRGASAGTRLGGSRRAALHFTPCRFDGKSRSSIRRLRYFKLVTVACGLPASQALSSESAPGCRDQLQVEILVLSSSSHGCHAGLARAIIVPYHSPTEFSSHDGSSRINLSCR